jgi:hypothetical protein
MNSSKTTFRKPRRLRRQHDDYHARGDDIDDDLNEGGDDDDDACDRRMLTNDDSWELPTACDERMMTMMMVMRRTMMKQKQLTVRTSEMMMMTMNDRQPTDRTRRPSGADEMTTLALIAADNIATDDDDCHATDYDAMRSGAWEWQPDAWKNSWAMLESHHDLTMMKMKMKNRFATLAAT